MPISQLLQTGDISLHGQGGVYKVNGTWDMKNISGDNIVISCSDQHLKFAKNVIELTDFLVQTFSIAGGRYHVHADIEELSKHYSCFPLGAEQWLPSMNNFDRFWNFSLMDSIQGWLGYSESITPRNEPDFAYRIASTCPRFMIGTKEQLHRYKAYAVMFPDKKYDIESAIETFGVHPE